MGREPKRDSRGLILSAAHVEFGKRGFAGGRVDRIAQQAGVNKQLIFYYFGSKAGLFRSVLESASQAIVGAAGSAADRGAPFERLRGVAQRVFEAILANADLVRMTVLTQGQPDGASSLLGDTLDRLRGSIRQIVSEGQGTGYVRDDVDPDVIARLVLATAVGSLAFDGATASALRTAVLDLLARALVW